MSIQTRYPGPLGRTVQRWRADRTITYEQPRTSRRAKWAEEGSGSPRLPAFFLLSSRPIHRGRKQNGLFAPTLRAFRRLHAVNRGARETAALRGARASVVATAETDDGLWHAGGRGERWASRQTQSPLGASGPAPRRSERRNWRRRRRGLHEDAMTRRAGLMLGCPSSLLAPPFLISRTLGDEGLFDGSKPC